MWEWQGISIWRIQTVRPSRKMICLCQGATSSRGSTLRVSTKINRELRGLERDHHGRLHHTQGQDGASMQSFLTLLPSPNSPSFPPQVRDNLIQAFIIWERMIHPCRSMSPWSPPDSWLLPPPLHHSCSLLFSQSFLYHPHCTPHFCHSMFYSLFHLVFHL